MTMAIEKVAEFIVGDKVIVGHNAGRDYSGDPKKGTIVSIGKWLRHTMNCNKVDDCSYNVLCEDGTMSHGYSRYIKHQEDPVIITVIKGKPKKIKVYSGTHKLYGILGNYVDIGSNVITKSKKELMEITELEDFQIDRALNELVKVKAISKVVIGSSVMYFGNPGIYNNDNATIVSMFS